MFFWGSRRGHEEEAADALKRFATVSNSLMCLYDASAVNKTCGCLPRMTFLFVFKAGKTWEPLLLRHPWPVHRFSPPCEPQWDSTHPEVHRWTSSSSSSVHSLVTLSTLWAHSHISNLKKIKSRKIKLHLHTFFFEKLRGKRWHDNINHGNVIFITELMWYFFLTIQIMN